MVKAIVRVVCDNPACKNMCEIEGTLLQAVDELRCMGWRLAFKDRPEHPRVREWKTYECYCPYHFSVPGQDEVVTDDD